MLVSFAILRLVVTKLKKFFIFRWHKVAHTRNSTGGIGKYNTVLPEWGEGARCRTIWTCHIGLGEQASWFYVHLLVFRNNHQFTSEAAVFFQATFLEKLRVYTLIFRNRPRKPTIGINWLWVASWKWSISLPSGWRSQAYPCRVFHLLISHYCHHSCNLPDLDLLRSNSLIRHM